MLRNFFMIFYVAWKIFFHSVEKPVFAVDGQRREVSNPSRERLPSIGPASVPHAARLAGRRRRRSGAGSAGTAVPVGAAAPAVGTVAGGPAGSRLEFGLGWFR